MKMRPLPLAPARESRRRSFRNFFSSEVSSILPRNDNLPEIILHVLFGEELVLRFLSERANRGNSLGSRKRSPPVLSCSSQTTGRERRETRQYFSMQISVQLIRLCPGTPAEKILRTTIDIILPRSACGAYADYPFAQAYTGKRSKEGRGDADAIRGGFEQMLLLIIFITRL